MLESLKNKVYNANQDLLEQSGCEFSWVSVSAIDREQGLVVLMPEGGALDPEDMAVLDLEGNVLEGKEPPVCDTAVHLQLYRNFPEIGAVAHPYSRWATVFAQLEMGIPTPVKSIWEVGRTNSIVSPARNLLLAWQPHPAASHRPQELEGALVISIPTPETHT